MTTPKEQVDLILRGTKFADESAEYGDPGGDSNLRRLAARELEQRILIAAKENRPLRVYLGVDPTRESLHIGHMVPVQKLRKFQQLGHTAIFLIGDYTARIGDPSGRSRTRPHLTTEEIAQNMVRYREQAFRILDPDRCEFRHNSEWSDPLRGADVIGLAARYTVARILEREDFRTRLEAGTPVHMHELLYPLFQGYDSVAVKADVELGGADQYWNLLVGRELQREFGQQPQVVMTVPLLVGLDGTRKMSKSYNNYVAITDPPERMFGKLMSLADNLMTDYCRLAADFSATELSAFNSRLEGGENPRALKAELARRVVMLFYSAEDAHRAEAEFDRVFRDRGLPEDIPDWSVPATGLGIIELITAAGLLSSRSEARRKLAEGAVQLDGTRVTDPHMVITVTGTPRVLKVGKRRFLRLVGT